MSTQIPAHAVSGAVQVPPVPPELLALEVLPPVPPELLAPALVALEVLEPVLAEALAGDPPEPLVNVVLAV